MWRNVLILMLTGFVACCCTLSDWTTSFSSKVLHTSWCARPKNDSSPAQPTRHECRCRNRMNLMAKSNSELFNFESLRVASRLDKLDLPTSLAEFAHDRDRHGVAVPADVSMGPFSHCHGMELLRVLQTMRC